MRAAGNLKRLGLAMKDWRNYALVILVLIGGAAIGVLFGLGPR
jgi:uncharacterized membrane protein YoaK (UPF0700 family)